MHQPTKPRSEAPVPRYAAIIAILVAIGLAAAIFVGTHAQNRAPAGSASSPAPGASVGPTPRY